MFHLRWRRLVFAIVQAWYFAALAAVAANADTNAIASLDMTGSSSWVRDQHAAIRFGFGNRREETGL